MSGAIPETQDWQPSLLPEQLRKINIPKSFINNNDSRWVLCDIISDFQHEEKQAIYYCAVFDTTIENVAKKIELPPFHVVNAIGLYSARLESKLRFFKKIMVYDENDLLPISELLFFDPSSRNFTCIT